MCAMSAIISMLTNHSFSWNNNFVIRCFKGIFYFEFTKLLAGYLLKSINSKYIKLFKEKKDLRVAPGSMFLKYRVFFIGLALSWVVILNAVTNIFA